MPPDIAVLICTYNRSHDLGSLLNTACHQTETGFTYEVIVVDNNSTDDTRATVEAVQHRAGQPPRYYFEPKQGKSFALNTGLSHVRAPLCVVIDDDQLMPPDYLSLLVRAFEVNSEVSFIGGKVLPIWEVAPPDWLTPSRWSPLGMADHGDESFSVDRKRPICLLTFAFRVQDVSAIGGFRNDLGVTGSRMGSTEDADLITRLVESGQHGLYVPELVLQHHAPARRMTQRYYRQWHYGHGGFSALFRNESVERSRFRVLDVPSHLFRQAIQDVATWMSAAVAGDSDRRFEAETRLFFFGGFLRERLRAF
jgi:glucosyl-dolichyl phosphate glucuronosyltransferase